MHSISRLISDKFIVALLNSTFISYYIKEFITSTHTLQINDGRLIPIKIPSQDSLRNIEMIVDQILSLTQSDNYLQNQTKQANVKEYEKEIDQMVYTLYGLTPDEIKTVEGER